MNEQNKQETTEYSIPHIVWAISFALGMMVCVGFMALVIAIGRVLL